MRLWFFALCLCSAFGPAAAYAEEREFKREDYESYFAPGHYASWSPFFESYGVMEVVRNRSTQASGQYVLELTTRAFDVSPNYDTLSEYPYYKIESGFDDRMVWDDRRKLYAYDYTDQDIRGRTWRAWESHDAKVELSATDLSRGLLMQFYREADKRAGRDPVAEDEAFRKEMVGMWTWACAYVRHEKFEVECKATSERSGRVETFFYRRLADLVG